MLSKALDYIITADRINKTYPNGVHALSDFQLKSIAVRFS